MHAYRTLIGCGLQRGLSIAFIVCNVTTVARCLDVQIKPLLFQYLWHIIIGQWVAQTAVCMCNHRMQLLSAQRHKQSIALPDALVHEDYVHINLTPGTYICDTPNHPDGYHT